MNKDFSLILQNRKVEKIEGVIVSEISESEKTQSFVFQNDLGERFLIRTDKYLNYFYGDRLSISGDLKVAENFENENGIIFNYQKYLLKDGITHTAFYPEIEKTKIAYQKDFKFYIFKTKEIFSNQSKKIFKKDTSALVLGVIFGIKDSIDNFLEDNFRRTGLIHILVLSGFNLTIIAYFVFRLLSGLHRNLRYIISLLFILIFVIMVGAGATIVRAGIMISVFIFSKLFYRNSNPLNALILAGAFMIFYNPMILLYDPSFQLSFMATIGLVSFYSLIEKIFKWITTKFGLREIIVSNISVQITIIPLLIFIMGEFSIISLLPNILILPIVPIFMLVAFLAIVFSFFTPGISLIFIFITQKLTEFIIFIVNYFGNFDFAVLKIGQMKTELLIAILFFYFAIILFLDLRKRFISKLRYNYLQS